MTYATPTSSDLGILLNDTTVNDARADYFIYAAEKLALSIVNPLPDGADVVVLRIAARGYVNATSARQVQLAAAGSPFGAAPPANQSGQPWLSRYDKADLRRMATGSNAFSINMLSATYAPDALPVWDFNSGDVGIATS